MNRRDAIRLQPTFPLDASRIRRLKWRKIFKSPMILGTLLAAGVAGTLMKLGWIGTGGLLGGAALGLAGYWRTRDASLSADIMQQLIDESNDQQDKQLRRMIGQLRLQGHPQYSVSLGKFLLLKQHIEGEMHADGPLTTRKRDMENLVDSICDRVCVEIHELAKLDDRLAAVLTSRDPTLLNALHTQRHQRHDRILQAYSAIFDTAERVLLVRQPGIPPRSPEDLEAEALDRMIEQLREENRIAEEVHDRLQQEIPSLGSLDS